MALTVLAGVDGVRAAVGQPLGRSDWVDVDQAAVDAFATATGAADLGYLVLSLTNQLLPQVVEVADVAMGLNLGTGSVRFPAPLPVPGRVRAAVELTAVDDVAGGVQTVMRITVEADGVATPVAVVDSLSRWLT